MYEHRGEPVVGRWRFVQRVLRHVLVASALVAVALGVGVVGYHGFERLPWLDSLLNASMIFERASSTFS